MNFQRGHGREQPEINLIPMIDVLLVIIIFLMLTTSYAKYSGLEINLPTADSTKQADQSNEINVVLSSTGQVQVDGVPLASSKVEAIADSLKRAAGSRKQPNVVINADAQIAHQKVVDVMQASMLSGLPRISFTTQAPQ